MSDLFPDDPLAVVARRDAAVRGYDEAISASDPAAPLVGPDVFPQVARGSASAGYKLSDAGTTIAYRTSRAINETVHQLTGWDPDPEQHIRQAEERMSASLREYRSRLQPDPNRSSQAGQVLFNLSCVGGFAANA